MNQPLQILLIDDDADDREIFALVMQNLDPTAVTGQAEDGYDALNKLNDDQYTPELIFLDLNMPKMHGLECLRQIRDIGRFNSLPVIVFSTSSSPHDISASQASGATDYIVKGHEISIIRTSLQEALKKYDPRLSSS